MQILKRELKFYNKTKYKCVSWITVRNSQTRHIPWRDIFPLVCFFKDPRQIKRIRKWIVHLFPLFSVAEFNPLINSILSAKNFLLLRFYSPLDAASIEGRDTFNAISEFCFTGLGKKELRADIHTCLSELTTWNSPPSLKWNFQCNNISGDDFPKHPFNNVDDTFHMWNNRYLTSVQKRFFAVSS